jgi:hypothetical protein
LKETIFSQKIAEKIGRFFGDFLGKNRDFLEKIAKNSRVIGKKSSV